MAEKTEEKKETSKKSYWENIDRWVTALTAIPVFGIVSKRLFEVFVEKGSEKIQKKAEDFFGLKEARKDFRDEIIYNTAVQRLDGDKPDEINQFENRLRKDNKKKAEAFVYFIAKIVMEFTRETTETIKPKKGESGPENRQQYKKIDEGIEEAKGFLNTLLKIKGIDEEETYKKRVDFLEGKNVFSVIAEAHPIIKNAEEGIKKVGKAIKTFATEDVVEGEKQNRQSLSQFAADLRAKSKARYERVKNQSI